MKSCKSYLFFSSAFYPIMCLMKSPKNFKTIAILKIWQLVSFWGVKTHFGEIHPWKDAFSGVKFFIFTSIAYLIVMVLTRLYSVIYLFKFSGTITYLRDNFYFYEAIFQSQIKHTSHRSEFWPRRIELGDGMKLKNC